MIVISNGDKTSKPKLKKYLDIRSTATNRAAYAAHPDAEPSALTKLSRDSLVGVRCNVAANPNTPVSTLEWLMKVKGAHKSKYIKAALATNPAIPVRMLEELYAIDVKVDEWDKTVENIVKGIAENPSATESLLLRIVESTGDGPTLLAASRNKGDGLTEAVLRLMATRDGWGKNSVSKHPRLPLDLIESFSKDKSYGVRMHIAEHPSTPVEILRELANDEYLAFGFYTVRVSVEKNPNTPQDVLVNIETRKSDWAEELGFKNEYESKIFYANREKQLRD